MIRETDVYGRSKYILSECSFLIDEQIKEKKENRGKGKASMFCPHRRACLTFVSLCFAVSCETDNRLVVGGDASPFEF